ncbi:MliC family protein [Marinomonas algarum]|uniref:MliC family protein n=1 Tax=Marinomonas algarum TaxID=2883105 RepID=A0A9X1RU75_9GAMM|nr:MliC family protein [Marinomonas algarum]MCB5162968.1 MliC family protein [Marinomonas algarum]
MRLLFTFTIVTLAVSVSACSSASGKRALTLDYQCISGETIRVTYQTGDEILVVHQGTEHTMTRAISGSGARYASPQYEWWSKGLNSASEGTLLQHKTNNTSGKILERCKVMTL